jgi:hypothetical protein
MLSSPILLGAAPAGYQLQRSLRFRASASAKLTRTPASAGNRRTFTISMWVKRGQLGASFATLYGAGANADYFSYQSDRLDVIFNNATYRVTANALFRDVSAFYHVVLRVDTTQATAADRVRLYVNGEQLTSLLNTNYPIQNYECAAFNTTTMQEIGWANGGGHFDGYLADAKIIVGQSLAPTAFAQFDSNGMWQPKPYTGTYGASDTHLDFSDPTSTTTLMADRSGNGNNWTANNVSLTAGATYDSMLDVPLGSGVNERGNYCTLNPLVTAADSTLSDGNLRFAYGSSNTIGITYATIGMTAGEYWWTTRILTNSSGSTSALVVGMSRLLAGSANNYPGFNSTGGWGYYGDTGAIYNNGSTVATGATFDVNDVIGCRFDATAGVLRLYKQTAGSGSFVLQATINSIPTETYFPAWGDGGGARTGSAAVNFGQQPLNETGWIGPAKALHTGNLPAASIPNPKLHFDVVTRLGTGASANVTGVGFQPDFVWIKSRSASVNHSLFDSPRGVQKCLRSSSTGAETTETDALSAFNSDGFSLGVSAAGAGVNVSGENYANWLWKAGGAPVTNNAGSISAQVSANPVAGFSIVTYTGTGANATVGHGLGVAPAMIIVKCRSNGTPNWRVWHKSLGTTDSYLGLNQTAAVATSTTIFNSQSSTTFGVGSDSSTNGVQNYVAYCFSEIPGYSKIGSYTGNGSTEGPNVICGFRPRWIMIKRTDSPQPWMIIDTARNTFNVAGDYLSSDSSGVENYGSARATSADLDILSNGFKPRNNASSSGYTNASGGTYIFYAVAEAPFTSALAR